ncbi:MAG: cupin domain-containing protein [Microbacteriaceae bacterium]|nr:cupin domain-containing protein [Microbacteriaceae bacterium]
MPITIIMRDAPAHALEGFLPKATSVSGNVTEASADLWSDSADGTVDVGIWQASVGVFSATRDGFHEVCYIIAGRATLVDEVGNEVDVTAGDLFVTPSGWRGTWHVHEDVRKVFVIVTTSGA